MTVGIIGGGPAGMSAALWLNRLGIDLLLVEREAELGGLQRLNFLENHWVLGEMDKTGPMLAKAYAAHIEALGIAPLLSARVRSVSREGAEFRLALDTPAGPAEHFVSAIVLAMGMRFRGREVLAQAADLESIDPDRLVWGPHAFRDLGRYRGKRLLVVGAGDNSHEFIRLSAEIADSFVLLARSRRKAQAGLRASVDTLAGQGRCEILEATSLTGVKQSGSRLTVDLAGAGGQRTAEVDAIVVLAGYEPNSAAIDQWLSADLQEQLRRDADGYLLTDAHGRTTCPGIYAAGDITNPAVPCVVTALAGGAVAARAVELELRKDRI